jgi:hypothetical protein
VREVEKKVIWAPTDLGKINFLLSFIYLNTLLKSHIFESASRWRRDARFWLTLGVKTRTIERHYVLDNKAIKQLELYLLIRIFDVDH